MRSFIRQPGFHAICFAPRGTTDALDSYSLVGVLSGGPSACGATGANLRDQYGGLFHAWDGLGTPTTRMRDHLDPLGTNPLTLDGVNAAAKDPGLIFRNGFG